MSGVGALPRSSWQAVMRPNRAPSVYAIRAAPRELRANREVGCMKWAILRSRVRVTNAPQSRASRGAAIARHPRFGTIRPRRSGRALLSCAPGPPTRSSSDMSAPVTLERYVGPALYVHGHGDVTVYEGTFEAGLTIPLHVHAEPVISLVLAGDGVEEVGDRTRLVTTQDLLLTPAYAPHGYRFGRSGRWFNMQLTDSWLARVADGAPALPAAAQIVHSHAAAA